jgi:DNA-binding NarL/FixJ family response regulator
MTRPRLDILLVEDSDQLAGATSRELEQVYGHKVTWVRDPTSLEEKLSKQRFDVAIVDVLYEHLNREFDVKRLARKIRVRGDQLLISGLSAIYMLRQKSPEVGTVVWTIGEANRRLHLLYAYENLVMRNYCSKSSGTGRADTLARSARMAHEGQQFIDPVLNPYLPLEKEHARRASDIILNDECKRAIWRAIAVGADTRSEIGRLAGYSDRTVGNRIPEMYRDLLEFDAGLVPSKSPFLEVVRYATSNWQFFLDEAVRLMYP